MACARVWRVVDSTHVCSHGGVGCDKQDLAADPTTAQRIMHTVMHGIVPPSLHVWEDPKHPRPRTTMISVAQSIQIEHEYRGRRRAAELEKAAAMMRWREDFPEGSQAFGSQESKACVDRLLNRAPPPPTSPAVPTPALTKAEDDTAMDADLAHVSL
eukprot:m.25458 g.25458  ORF g.25458 m.25458 type:complete len:157 (-) comp11498_c0_seq2:76-546(-)